MRKTRILLLLAVLLMSAPATAKTALFSDPPLAEDALARVTAGPIPSSIGASPGASGVAATMDNRAGTGSFYGRVISEQSIRPFVDAADRSRNSGLGAIFGLNILILD